MITNLDIIGELERLGAACPWDGVDIWTKREPEGVYDFTAYVRQNDKFGFPSIFGTGATPKEAVDDAILQTGNRDPEISRRRILAELRAKIEKLQAVVVGLPPYRPGRELSNGEPAIRQTGTVDV